jgi:hypothetical protein
MPDDKPKRTRATRLHVLVSASDLARIENFRFRTRMPTHAAAVRELLKRGLASADNQSRSSRKSS